MIKRTISFAVIFMMLWSFVAPMSAAAGHCAGTEAVQAALASAEPSHPGCTGHSAPEVTTADHQTAKHSGDQVHTSPSAGNRFSFCCTHAATTVRAELDVPTLTAPVISWTVVLPVAINSLFVQIPVDQASSLASAYKIGSSPPWIAIAGQHTYQRTCLLLI